eukprot:757699-Hanusia_phi.AAC.1
MPLPSSECSRDGGGGGCGSGGTPGRVHSDPADRTGRARAGGDRGIGRSDHNVTRVAVAQCPRPGHLTRQVIRACFKAWPPPDRACRASGESEFTRLESAGPGPVEVTPSDPVVRPRAARPGDPGPPGTRYGHRVRR